MIWHIFRKDWKLLWWKALIAAGLMMTGAISLVAQGHFGSGESASVSVPSVLGFGAALFLVMELVQLDPLEGAGQDWVARPIRRMDLLLAKILFLLLTLALPMLLAEMIQDLAGGVPFGRSLTGATFDVISGMLSIGLPTVAFASLFRNLTQTMAAVFVGILMLFTVGLAIQGNARFPLAGGEAGTGLSWMVDMTESAFYLAGALVVFAIQYFHRRTTLGRCVAAAVLLLVSLTPLMMPWGAAFAVEQRLSPVQDAGASVKVFFSPSDGRFEGTGLGQFAVCLPVAVSGVARGSWVNIDSLKASLLDGDGVAWSKRISAAAGQEASPQNGMRGWLRNTTTGGICQPIDAGDLRRYEDQPVRVQIDYSLTLFAPDNSYAMPAWNGDQRMPGLGWCQTRTRDRLELGCISDSGPVCLEATIHAPGHPNAYYCKPDYDAIRGVDTDPWGVSLSLNVRKGDTLVLRSYRPLDHFERQVTTPEIKLRDWLTAGQ